MKTGPFFWQNHQLYLVIFNIIQDFFAMKASGWLTNSQKPAGGRFGFYLKSLRQTRSPHSFRLSTPPVRPVHSLSVNISCSERRLRSRSAWTSSTVMAPAGELTAFWITALLTCLGAQLGGKHLWHTLQSAGAFTNLCFCVSIETKTVFPYVPFPPALPITENLAAICQEGSGRPRYPDSFFPPSGYSHDRRRGKAINRLESWFSLCCSGLVAQQPSQILCCAQQAVSRWGCSESEILIYVPAEQTLKVRITNSGGKCHRDRKWIWWVH